MKCIHRRVSSNTAMLLTRSSSHKLHISIFVSYAQAERAQDEGVSIWVWHGVSRVRVLKTVQQISNSYIYHEYTRY
jgi:hypothetical protein